MLRIRRTRRPKAKKGLLKWQQMRDSVRKCIYKTCRDTIQSKDKKQTQLRYSRPTEPNQKHKNKDESLFVKSIVSNQPWETCADFSVVKSTRGDSYVNGPLIKRAKNWTRSQFAKCQCERKHFSYAALWWHIWQIYSHYLTVHGHFIDLGGVVLLNVSQDPDVVVLDKVDRNTLDITRCKQILRQ